MQNNAAPAPSSPLTSKFEAKKNRPDDACDKIVIAGGGMAGIFTAYQILKKAGEAGKKIDVLVLADRINAPCAAGSHAVLGMEGLYDDEADIKNRPQIFAMIKEAIKSMEQTIKDEKIDCRFNRAYEIKATDKETLDGAVQSMIELAGYPATSIKPNSKNQVFNLPGHDHSASIDCIGQVNTPELLNGLIDRIRHMGGQVIEGVRYEGQSKNKDGTYTVHTNQGDYDTASKPFLATGAAHLNSLPEFKAADCEIIHTMAIVTGPLSPTDAARISKGPMAIVNTDLGGDVLWGGLDEKNFFTLGRGDTKDASNESRERIRADILNQIETLYPGLLQKYTPTASFGAMLSPSNGLPVVGRMKNYDVAGGWGGLGIVPGWAAADAYADMVVNGNDKELKLFESMHPEVFSPPAPAANPAETHTAHL
jgi:glycine/D-amino acid oxidase-like deaminating enzyme